MFVLHWKRPRGRIYKEELFPAWMIRRRISPRFKSLSIMSRPQTPPFTYQIPVDRRLPRNRTEWASLARQCGVDKASLHQVPCTSASSIEDVQFLGLRALWLRTVEAKRPGPKQAWEGQVTLQAWVEAQRILNAMNGWDRYIRSIKEDQRKLRSEGFLGLGAFSLVRHQQLATMKVSQTVAASTKLDFTPLARRTRSLLPPSDMDRPSRVLIDAISDAVAALNLGAGASGGDVASAQGSISSSGPWPSSDSEWDAPAPPSEDEQIVNTALVLFLNAIFIHCAKIKADWSLYRRSFTARDRGNQKTYEARVDGVLQHHQRDSQGDNPTLAIIEVKPFQRKEGDIKTKNLLKQEAAQMAAWISQHPPQVASHDLYKLVFLRSVSCNASLALGPSSSTIVRAFTNMSDCADACWYRRIDMRYT